LPEDPHVDAEDVYDPTDEPVDEPEDEPVAVEPDKDSPTLPDAYRRSLIASEWSEKEIDEFFAANPQGALTFAEKVHRTRNAETARFAAAGRQAREAAAAAAPTVEASQADAGLMTPVNVDELVEKYGNEEVIRALSTPVNAAIDRINQMLPEIQKGVKSAQQARREALATVVENFFASDELKPYAEVYGVGGDTPSTEVQKKNWKQVLENADAIITGAALQGRQFTAEEALMLAHDSIAKEFQAELIRKDIKGKTKKRAKGVSLKPTGRKAGGGSDGKPSTRKQLEKQVAVGLKGVFK